MSKDNSSTNNDIPHATLDLITVEASGCDYNCGKTGIPILPVVFSQESYKLNANDKRYFKSTKLTKSKAQDAVASLPSHVYLYTYIMDGQKEKFIFEYMTGQDGALKETKRYLSEDLADGEIKGGQNTIALKNIDETSDESSGDSQPFNCTDKDHSTFDSKYLRFYIEDTVWLMVSHAKLSRATLKKYYDDETIRDKRMQKFVVSDLANNINTATMTEMLPEVDYIKSFHQRQQLAQGRDIDDRVVATEKVGLDTHSGNSKAAVLLYQSMQRAIDDSDLDEAVKQSIKPMMVALPDPVGEVLAAAEKRNYLLKKLDDAQKDEDKVREQVNAIIIDNLKSSIETSSGYDSTVPLSPATYAYHIEGQSKVDNQNFKNIYKYIDEGRFQQVLKSAKKSIELKQQLSEARASFIKAFNNPEFAKVMLNDFPENDEDSHEGYAKIIAAAIQGIGVDESNLGIPDGIWSNNTIQQSNGITAKQEFEQTLLPFINGSVSPKQNFIIKALIGLNTDDIQRMSNAPTFDKLDRASDFIGTTTSWVMAFKTQNKKNQITANIANRVEKINNLANYKAQIIQTLSANLSHIQDNHKLLYKLDLWTQASVHQTTGFRLAQRVLKYSPEAILKWSEQRLSNAINKAKPHSGLLPAAINTKAINHSSNLKTPIAIDLIGSHNITQQGLEIFDRSSRGDNAARKIITMYVSDDVAGATQSINSELDAQVAQLNKDLDPISGQYRQLERTSAGKAALVSAGIGLFQLRSMWIGKNSIANMATRGDRDALEFMTSYASSTMALTSASLDVVNAGMQMKVARSAWFARLGMSVGVIGVIGAGFEVYSLELYRERLSDSGSDVSRVAVVTAQTAAIAAGVAGFGYGTILAVGAGTFLLPWLGAIIAIAWGISLIAQWVAFTYDKSHILPIHYWLDAGVFGKKEMLNVNDYPLNPFAKHPMQNLKQDIRAYSLALTQVTVVPQITYDVQNFRKIRHTKLLVTISQWQQDSLLNLITFGLNVDGEPTTANNTSIIYVTESVQRLAKLTEQGVELIVDLPETSYYQYQYLGSEREGTLNLARQQHMQKAKEHAEAHPEQEAKELEINIFFYLDNETPKYAIKQIIRT